MALPPEGVLRAASRWVELLRSSSIAQASVLLRSAASFTDLSPTQYALGLDWLRETKVLRAAVPDWELDPRIKALPSTSVPLAMLDRTLAEADPPWLPDADVLVRDDSDLPEDVTAMASALGVSSRDALSVVRQVHGRVDLAERSRVGAAGERALVALLNAEWPASATHVALSDDGLGYDVVLELDAKGWHLEVKSTTRRGRLAAYLSRHEYNVSSVDSSWQLVLVGLDEGSQISALATVRAGLLNERSPMDVLGARWESARFDLGPNDIETGLPFVSEARSLAGCSSLVRTGSHASSGQFAWMPPTKSEDTES